MKKKDYIIVLFSLLFINTNISLAQLFPNPATLSTGQGNPGSQDPLWTCSPWYATPPTDPSAATYTPALINNNCAPGNWVNPASLPIPVNNGNWITGQESNCAQNKTSGYRFFRLELNLPADCNGFSVTQIGNYSLSFVGYVDNYISEVFLNNNPLGISGGSFTAGSQISFTINGPWQVGVNYIDVLVHNYPASNPNSNNPYGLLLVADANSLNGNDTDGDGVSDLFDECPCTPGNNSVGCVDNSTCDIALIRSTFANAGCQELDGCWDECSMYFLNPQYLSGSDAQAFAQNLGANLISIQSAAENACILSDLNRLGYGSGDVIWIGFNDEAVEGQFEWYDQSAIVYTNWAPGEPNNSGGNEDCVQIYPGGSNPGTWNDLNCNGYNSLSVIEVNLCPITNVTPPITMCQGSDTTIKVISTILGSSPYTYQWDNGSTQVSQTISPMQSTDYYVTTSDRYSCSTNDTIAVTVNTQPTVSIVGSTTICEGDNITLTASGTPTGGTYTWNNGAGTSATVSVSPSVTTTYVVNYAINGCDEIDSITITVTPKATPSFTNPGPICQGDALILPTENTGIAGTWNPSVANNQVTTTYTFTPNTGVCANLGMMTVTVNPSVTPTFNQLPAVCAGSAIALPTTSNNGISGAWSPAVNNQQTTTYTFTPNSGNTCVVTSQITVQVNPLPNISAGTNQTICNGNPITLTATGGVTYSWNNGVNGSSQNVSPNMTTTYVVIGVDANNCENIDSVTINVLDSIITMTADTVVGCSPLIVQFSSTSLGDAIYNWDFGDGTSSTEINPEHIYHNDSCFTVSLTINSGQCTYSLIKTDMICVYPSPQASFVASSYFISDVMNQVSFNNLSLNATNYDWYFGDETGHSTVVHPTYVYAPEIIQNYNVMLIASNESGCVDTARALIEMNREIVFFIPNTFTPDGDQFNNVFLPIIANGLDYFDYEMMVFDRWGEVIFETHDMHVGWDGTYNLTGKICQDGTYVWKIVVRIAGTSEKIERSGHVLLLR